MLHRTDTPNIDIRVTTTSSMLDRSLLEFQNYFLAQLQTSTLQPLLSESSGVVLDLGILGLDDSGRDDRDPPSWKNHVTYPLRLFHSLIILGPLYLPGQPGVPCPCCLERRWFNTRIKDEQAAFIDRGEIAINGANPHITRFTLEMAWLLLQSTLPRALGHVHTQEELHSFYVLDLDSMRTFCAALTQDPACPVCSFPPTDTPDAALVTVESHLKQAPLKYRLVNATAYDFTFSALVNPVVGMLATSVVHEMHHSLVSPANGRFQFRGSRGIREILWSGHGYNYDQSERLGILEGLERYAGMKPRARRTVVIDSYAHRSSEALDPRTCGLYQEDFYHTTTRYQIFSPDLKLPWIWGYSFREARPLLVPEQLVYYMDHRPDQTNFVQASSSGCASGSCLEEALLYGLWELIERDAFLLTWYARLSPPKIDPRSCHRQETLFVVDAIERHGYELFLLDTRFDVRVPSVLAIARRKEPGLGNMLLAAGASMDPEDAVRSALCELACYIPYMEPRVKEKLEIVRAMAKDYSKITELEHHALLHGLPEMAPYNEFLTKNTMMRSFEETYADWWESYSPGQDLRDDLLFCVNALAKLELDVIVVDQTCPEQVKEGVTTVCALVPGLLPIDFGWDHHRVFDLPRLYTVPRMLGYRDENFIGDKSTIVPHPFP